MFYGELRVAGSVGSQISELERFQPGGCKDSDRSPRHTLTDEATILVLTRKTGQEIIIDGEIRVTVTSIGDGRVKIGISAPPHIKVDRAEVAARIAAEEADADVLVCG